MELLYMLRPFQFWWRIAVALFIGGLFGAPLAWIIAVPFELSDYLASIVRNLFGVGDFRTLQGSRRFVYDQDETLFTDTWQPIPALLIAGVVFMVLCRRRIADSETRCRSCSYILRGLTEPRCPECGQVI
jgi:hypothetical protein